MKTLAAESARQRSWRQTLPRLWGRLKHGLLTQEILDRLAHAGLVIYPYFVALEKAATDSEPELAAGQTVRALSADDAAQMVRVDARYPAGPFTDRLARAECLGLFVGSELVGYSWAKLDLVPIPGSSGAPLLALQPHEAYLFDIFVAVGYRGLRLGEVIRRAVHSDLARRGRTHFYSFTLAFNRSPRRLLARAGVRDLELRLFLGLGRRTPAGLDARLWRRAPYLRTSWLTRVMTPRPTAFR
jgi:hypothetical protein